MQILKCPLVPHKDPNKLFHAKKALRRKTSLQCCWGLYAYPVVTFEQSLNPQLPPKPPQIIHANELFFHVIRKQITESSCANSLDLNDGKNFTTMEWLMVFCQSTIVVDGFSMFFFTCEPLVSMVFQWFFSCEPLASMVFQWFFRFQPLVSMVFPMVFSNPTNPIFRQTNLAQCYKETSERTPLTSD